MTPRAWKRLFARIVLWAGIGLGIVVLFFLIKATWHVYTKERVAAQAHAEEARALSELSARKESLTAEITRLDSARGIETEVRQRYPVAKSGEEVIVLTNSPNATSSAPKAPPSLWERFLGWFSW